MLRAEEEPPPLPSIPDKLVLDPDTEHYVSDDDQSSIPKSLTTSDTRERRPPKSIANEALATLDNVMKDRPPAKPIPDPLQTASNHLGRHTRHQNKAAPSRP